ncbi:DUF2637 domain-containing protein [Streptomyces sp. H10-C2]|uniref:DUF2637 domain-containing protein n=1 Tax=unclassified Streptomyces TaxID=2593676 RepID=UPI0024BA380B|nr:MULTISPECIES: DUF2637 domain-containing protein [unclassified Streptomyces]MDJ0342599.1 DUF2637 domain-containing protein [Streptomyces sp. PH10-H1]MDJ0368547.1 DUF2637 domain-containing protein [Streptomyces sp. H10-C2]
MPDTAIPAAGPAEPTSRHRATWWDQAAIILLGLAGCALSFDALRQMATAVHVRHQLTYLFPVVIDGFIAYGVRALLVLRDAPLPARLYAWTLFIAATAASIWANGLHALDLNQPGTVELHLDDTTVTILSAIAPLALAGATHLHILITRHGSNGPSQTPPHRTAAGVPYEEPVGTEAPSQRGTQQPSATESTPAAATESFGGEEPAAPLPDTATAAVTPTDSHQDEHQDDSDSAGQGQDGGSVPRTQAQGGRPPMASLQRLAEVIAAAHRDPDTLTRDSARKALTESGLGAGTHRLTEAIALVRNASQAREHPAQPEEPQPLADRA